MLDGLTWSAAWAQAELMFEIVSPIAVYMVGAMMAFWILMLARAWVSGEGQVAAAAPGAAQAAAAPSAMESSKGKGLKRRSKISARPGTPRAGFVEPETETAFYTGDATGYGADPHSQSWGSPS